jgi:hypothetical protein
MMTTNQISRASSALAGALAAPPGSPAEEQFLVIVMNCFRAQGALPLPEFMRQAFRGLVPVLTPTPELIERISLSDDEEEIERLLRDDWLLDSLHTAGKRILD